MTTFNAIRMDTPPVVKEKTVICGCSFCKYKEQRRDVDHYKLFSRNNTGMPEYYLHIDKTQMLVEVVEKP